MSIRRALAAAALGVLALARSAAAQDPLPPPPPLDVEQRVAGRVLVAGDSTRPVPGVWVALNRVGADTALVIDSVRTDVQGGYGFVFRRTGEPTAIYFTDVRYGGIAYFTAPFRAAQVVGPDADLVVFDTTSANARIVTRGRHLAIGPRTPDGLHPVVEVFELSNDDSLTVVPAGNGRPVWQARLPARARDPEPGEDELGAGVVEFRDGRVQLFAPLAPGLRQLSVRYALPAAAFPLDLVLPDSTDVLEVLLAPPDASVSGGGLTARAAVELEGMRYRRWLATEIGPGETVRISLDAARPVGEAVLPALIATAALGLGGALWWRGRRARAR